MTKSRLSAAPNVSLFKELRCQERRYLLNIQRSADPKSTARSLVDLCEDEALDLVELGKALELLIQHANVVVEASGRTSIRWAAEHALDLGTPKSQLELF